MPKAHPKEFRDDVVAVAPKGDAPIPQLAKDFGISESCLRNWLRIADVQDGNRSGRARRTRMGWAVTAERALRTARRWLTSVV